MLRVLFYLPDLSGGGAQRTLLNLASEIARIDGFDLHLVLGAAEGGAAKWIDPSVPVTQLPSARARKQIGALRKVIQDLKPQAVVSTMLHGNVTAWLATRFLKDAPALLLRETNSHAFRTDLGFRHKVLAGLAYRAADRFIALSEGVRQEMIQLYQLSPDKAVTLHNPVDLTPYHGAATHRENGTFRIVTIGRLADQKNHRLLLDAVALLDPGSLSVSVLGEGPLRDETIGYAKEQGLSDIVTFPGFVQNPEDWLRDADLFVLSSKYEGFGHVLVEAMASGTPVVSTDCPYGPVDIIEVGKSGLLVPNNDSRALADAIEKVRHDPELQSRLATGGLKRAQDFSAPLIAAHYADLIHKTVSQKTCAE